MTGAAGLGGGIAAANLTVLEALVETTRRNRVSLQVLSLHENHCDRPPSLPESVSFDGYRGRTWAFACGLLCRYRPGTTYVFDHIHLALPIAPLLALGLAKLVVFAHGSESSRRLRPASRWLFRHAALCLANSRHTLNRMRTRLSSFRGTECELGLSPRHLLNTDTPVEHDEPVSLENLRGEPVPVGRRMILLVARMNAAEREKGHFRLLDAWPGLLREFPDAQLVLAGSGDDFDQIAAYARRLGVDGSVLMPGFVPEDMLAKLYSRCFAFVMPSLQEGFGLVYLEAMNYAKPCVGCTGDGAECVIVDGETGFLLEDPDSRSELLGVLLELFRDEALAGRMGAEGLRRLNDRFTAAHAQQRISRHLGRLL